MNLIIIKIRRFLAKSKQKRQKNHLPPHAAVAKKNMIQKIVTMIQMRQMRQIARIVQTNLTDQVIENIQKKQMIRGRY